MDKLDIFIEYGNKLLDTANLVLENSKKIKMEKPNIKSLLNPNYALEKDEDRGLILSFILGELYLCLSNAIIDNKKDYIRKKELFEKIIKLENKTNENIVNIYKNWYETHIEEIYKEEIFSELNYNNIYRKILEKSNGNPDILYKYGVYIDSDEIKMYEKLYDFPEDKIKKAGIHIAKAFLHGFISQSRDINNRKKIKFHYQIGQERLAIYVFRHLQDKGFEPIVTKPRGMYNNYFYKNQIYKSIYIDKEKSKKAYEKGLKFYENELLDVCGMIGIDQFGGEEEKPMGLNEYFTKKEIMDIRDLQNFIRNEEAKYLKPHTLSFAKAAYPNMRTGYDFNEIFNEFLEINTEESKPYEIIQDSIIKAFDKCIGAKIIGKDKNKTDIYISFKKLLNPESETLFLNCGGDLNIPHGEIFTTPILENTSGIYHVKNVFLRGILYRDLELKFKDGRIIDYSAKNHGNNIIEENLFNNNKDLTMGEFAIGSNTKAYKVVKDYELDEQMPILLYEKMGPHIAIGDPCFARSEDYPIYNLVYIEDREERGKEMVARGNEITLKDNPEYFNYHLDITIPYEEVEVLQGIMEDGNTIDIIRDGLFVLEGAKELNKSLL